MSIIGISGKKNSGKNTVAIMIQYLYHTGINRSMSINTYIAGYNENVTRPMDIDLHLKK
jgi:molybdopterin-guanine dinucleotide biosynthesis protein